TVLPGQVSDALYLPRRSSGRGEETSEDAVAWPSALRESSARRYASAGGLAPTRAVRFTATIREPPVLAGSSERGIAVPGAQSLARSSGIGACGSGTGLNPS